MSNADTKRNGVQAVIQYERQQGRTDVQMVQKTGFDLITKGNGEERHIQVKGTDKALFTDRWLEPSQYDALQNDSHFYLYLVTNANDPAARRIWIYDQKRTMARYSREVKKYYFAFPKQDFE
jgi:hypothetical protein